MSQPSRDLLPSLIQIAEINLPQLKHEIDTNGSAIFKLQAAVGELHSIVTYLVHHMIDERRRLLAIGSPGAAQAAAPAPVPAAVQAPQKYVPPAVQRLPLPPLSPAAPIAPAAASPAQADRGPVMEVTITPTGTRASIPGAPAPIVVPPGAAIDASMLATAVPPTGDGNVLLPRGGEMSPEVAAALAASGGARNVTQDPAQG